MEPHDSGPERPAPAGASPDADPTKLTQALESTAVLLGRVRKGDGDALNDLFARCRPLLRSFARGRLPMGARGMLDTQDLVQEAMTSALAHVDGFESRHPGGFLGFLRETVRNRIIDEFRRLGRRPPAAELTDEHQSDAPSPLQIAIGREEFERYDRAMSRLSPRDRDAIVYRLELHYDYKTVAEVLGKPTANAARAAVKRALERLMEYMDHEG